MASFKALVQMHVVNEQVSGLFSRFHDLCAIADNLECWLYSVDMVS